MKKSKKVQKKAAGARRIPAKKSTRVRGINRVVVTDGKITPK